MGKCLSGEEFNQQIASFETPVLRSDGFIDIYLFYKNVKIQRCVTELFLGTNQLDIFFFLSFH